MKIKTIRTVAGLIGALAFASPLWSYSYLTNDDGLALKWYGSSIAVKIMADNSTKLADGTTRATCIQAAMRDGTRGWNQYLGTAQFAPQIAAVGTGAQGNGVNEVTFSSTTYGQAWDNNALAVTIYHFSGDQLTESDIIFNTAYTWDSYRGALRSNGVYDIQRVALHELGHILGLDHPDQHSQYLTAIMNSAVSDIDSLQADDITGAQSLYGAPGSVPGNNSFANATTLSVGSYSTQSFGTNVAATKESGEPNHAGNAGGHSVWWKWTPTANGALTVTTAGSFFDTLLGVYTGGSVSSLTLVGSNDDSPDQPNRASAVTVNVTSGVGYYVAVDGKDGDRGSITLNASFFVPSPPVFYSQPYAQTVYGGQSATFSVYADGTPAPTFQWQRQPAGSGTWANLSDGGAYSGTTASYMGIAVTTVGMNGDQFRCVATNIAGSLTSSAALLTVNAPVAPAIYYLPANLAVNYGDTLNLYPTIAGTTPITFQWSKDGTALPSATYSSFYKSGVTTADSGTYTLAATNSVGTTTAAVTVIVNPAVAPVITGLSATVTLNYGDSLSLYPNVTGTQPMTFQWAKDGTALSNGTYSSYYKYNITTLDSGQYTLTATNVAGTTTSIGVNVIVNPAVAPAIYNLPATVTVNYGDYLSIYASVSGTAPMAFQWSKDGTPLPNGGYSSYSKSYATIADSGNYTLTASNFVGITTSTTVVVTVNPAVAPTISNLPATITLNYGDYLNIYPYVSGTSPIAYQWTKDGTAISGGTYSYYSKSYVTPADSGKYVLTASNLAGAATSSTVTVTVNPAVAPTISNMPATIALNYGDSLSIYPYITGTPPMTFQWSKNGTVVPNAYNGNYYLYYATTADSGTYTLTATNLVGSTTSSATSVTVNAAVAPAITLQPVSVRVARGLPASFWVVATGTNPLSYQWYLNGQAISGATYNSYYLNPVAAANAGTYTVTVTNLAGSVTSSPATLVVLPPLPPSVTNWPHSPVTITAGSYSSLYLSVYNVQGSPPFTYQWFKDGTAIPGATDSTYSRYNVTQADAGIYTLQITNDAGMISSPDILVIWVDNTLPAPWLDSFRLGDVVYFLAASPGRIMRYDLAQETWLATVNLTAAQTPTAFLPTPEGVFIAYGQNLAVRSPDLQTETAVATSTNTINCLFGYGSLIYYQDGSLVRSFNRADLSPGPAFPPTSWAGLGGLTRTARPVFSSTLNCAFTTRPYVSPNDIIKVAIAADGSFPSDVDSPYHGNFAIGTRQYLSPDEQLLIDNSGVVYHSADLTYASSLGWSFDDITFLDDGTSVVLRGNVLSAMAGSAFVETGRVSLAAKGYSLFNRTGATYVFGAPATVGGSPVVTKVLSTDFAPAALPAAFDPVNKVFSIDDAFVDANGVINLLSRTAQGLVRWDPQTGGFLATLPLRGRPAMSSYAPANGRLVLAYSDGTVTQFQTATDTTDHAFANLNIYNAPFALVAMDDLTEINIQDAGTTGNSRLVLGALGDTRFWSNAGLYSGPGLAWQSTNRRLYSNSAFSGTIVFEDVPTTGILPGQNGGGSSSIVAPLRFDADGSHGLAGNGFIVNASLMSVGAIANAITDGAWLPGGLFTIRSDLNGTQMQKWALGTYAAAGSLVLPGNPVRIFALNENSVAVVTVVNGHVAFYLVSSDLVLGPYSFNTAASPLPPTISRHPQSQVAVARTRATFVFDVLGAPAPGCHWQRLPAGGSTWIDLSDDATYSGTQTNVLGINRPTFAMNGDQFRCVATSSAGSVISNPAALTVAMSSSADFNADNQADLVWSNSANGDRYIWLMNGNAIASSVYLGNVPPQWTVATGDFNGDGQTDLLWSNTANGDRYIWLMNGNAVTSSVYLGAVPPQWAVVTGDFNGDGQSDLLWSNSTTGDRYVWLMNGTAVSSSAYLGNRNRNWLVAGTGDFNADGHTDIVWQNTLTGECSIWLMNGTNPIGNVSLGLVSTTMRIAMVGDYNGDNQPDLVWQNNVTGERLIWLMNGTDALSSVSLGMVDPQWTIGPNVVPAPVEHTSADFNADGQSDLLWSNTSTGDRYFWLMNGTSVASSVFLGTVAPPWTVVTGDFNADGQSDLLWSNAATGDRYVWLMNDTAVSSSVFLGTVAPQWTVVTGDFNADGQSDLLWSNTATGDRYFWLMNGTSVGSSVFLGNVAPQWTVATGDFNADGQSDLLWSNTATGDRYFWLMNGTSVGSSVFLGNVAPQWTATTGDFNADGQTDLLWSNTATGDRYVWLMNGTSVGSSVFLGNVGIPWTIAN